MQSRAKWIAVTSVAPIAWGSSYVVTGEFLPGEDPLWGAALRGLPAGLVLLALARTLPSGVWWWRAVVLGILNVAGFHSLVYLASTELPASMASTIMATSPIAIALSGWALLGQRPTTRAMVAAVVGIGGVVLIVGGASGAISTVGVIASLAAMISSSIGFALSTRWSTRDGALSTPELLSTTAWQIAAGGLILVLVAPVVEGAPPALGASEILAFGYISIIATALAFICWFAGLKRLRSEEVGLVGLLNPVAGVLLGIAIAGEVLTLLQAIGIAVVLLSVLAGSWRRRTAPAVQLEIIDAETPPAPVR